MNEARRDAIRARQRRYYRANPEKFAKRAKAWRRRNAEHLRAYKAKHRDRDRERSRKWRKSNLAKLAEYQRRYRRKYPHRMRLYEAKRQRTPDQIQRFKEYCKVWHAAHPESRQSSYQRRRARISASHNRVTPAALLNLYQKSGGKCCYCEQPLDNRGRGHLEHRRPLSRGGSHIMKNLSLACSRCNLHKGTRTVAEFMRSKYFIRSASL